VKRHRVRMKTGFLVLSALFLLAVLLAGCGGAATTTVTTAPATTTTAAAATSTTPTTAAAATTTAGGQKVSWTFNISGTGTATSPYGLTAKYFADKVAEMSGGRMEIKLHYGGDLGYKAGEMLEVISQGLVDGGDLSLPNIAGSEPLGNLGSVPFLHQGYDQYFKWVDEILVPRLAPILEQKWKVVTFGTYTFGKMFVLWNEKLENVDQLKGQRFRVFGDINSKFWSSLGVNVIALPVEELQQAMERKMIDGMPNSNPLIEQLQAWQYYKYRNDPGAIIGSSFFAINKNSYDKLPADLQKVVMDAGKEMTKNGRELLAKDEVRMDTVTKEKGMETFIVPEATVAKMREAGKQAWISWAAANGPDAQKIMDETFKMVGIQK
jgi:TRAP-type C4-dicarboxylate transport system substrate-binding protein